MSPEFGGKWVFWHNVPSAYPAICGMHECWYMKLLWTPLGIKREVSSSIVFANWNGSVNQFFFSFTNLFFPYTFHFLKHLLSYIGLSRKIECNLPHIVLLLPSLQFIILSDNNNIFLVFRFILRITYFIILFNIFYFYIFIFFIKYLK